MVGECTCYKCLSHYLFKGFLSWGESLVVVQDTAQALAYLREHQDVNLLSVCVFPYLIVVYDMCFVLFEQIVLSLSSSSIVIDDDMKRKLFDNAFLRLDTSPVSI